MEEERRDAPFANIEVTDEDKLWGTLSWLPIFGVILAVFSLMVEPQNKRLFIRFHAVQSIAVNIIIALLSAFLIWTACMPLIIGFLTIYPAIKAYQGEWLEIPFLTEFCLDQGWI